MGYMTAAIIIGKDITKLIVLDRFKSGDIIPQGLEANHIM